MTGPKNRTPNHHVACRSLQTNPQRRECVLPLQARSCRLKAESPREALASTNEPRRFGVGEKRLLCNSTCLSFDHLFELNEKHTADLCTMVVFPKPSEVTAAVPLIAKEVVSVTQIKILGFAKLTQDMGRCQKFGVGSVNHTDTFSKTSVGLAHSASFRAQQLNLISSSNCLSILHGSGPSRYVTSHYCKASCAIVAMACTSTTTACAGHPEPAYLHATERAKCSKFFADLLSSRQTWTPADPTSLECSEKLSIELTVVGLPVPVDYESCASLGSCRGLGLERSLRGSDFISWRSLLHPELPSPTFCPAGARS
jgi:hypothetical protein